MKLEFESNAVSSPLVSNHVPAEFDEPHSSPEVLETLREGIKAAQDGDRAEARNLLLSVTESDPQNENAWLWLASISEYPEELLVFLNNVLQINPENERAIEWAEATKSLIAKTFVQRGIDAAKDDQKKFAKQCFLQAIVHDSKSELAYLWLASVSDSAEEKMSHLQRVLSINPENENAHSSLRNAKENKAKGLLPRANTAAISGKHDEANSLLDEIFADAPDFEDAWMLKAHISDSFDQKIQAFERVLEINPENPVARANIDSLKMFAVNSESVDGADAEDVFQDSQQFFADAVPSHDTEMESASDVEAQTEQFSGESENASDFEYHEEEAVSFDEVAPEVEQSFDAPVEEEEDLFELDAADQSVEEEDVEMEAESSVEADASDDADLSDQDEVKLEEESHDQEVDSVDHDYVAENVDFNADDEVELEAESAMDVQENVDADEELEAELEFAGESSEDNQDEQFEEPVNEDSHEMSMESDVDASGEMELEHEAEFDSQDEAAEVESKDSGEPEMPNFETAEALSPELPSESASKSQSCAYCKESNENQAFACHNCKAIFTISDIEMILSHDKADTEVISKALERMEIEKSLRGVDVEELKYLGIGYLNLKDFRKGFDYLQEAAKKDQSDVLLVSQMDALALRLAEIEDTERDAEPQTVGKKILVVDDSPTVRKLISGKLEKCGHEPICAVDGMDALAKINEEIPDLVLLDITMPRMDGYQVCKLIRGNEATKDVPVVMISGKDGFFDKVRGRMAGTSNYITKPFGPETLMKTVNEYIQ